LAFDFALPALAFGAPARLVLALAVGPPFIPMLALPLAPLHGDHERCVARNDEPLEAPEPTAEVQMPFAALGALMGRARPDEPKRPVKGRRRGD
jgi:hypothetical protein